MKIVSPLKSSSLTTLKPILQHHTSSFISLKPFKPNLLKIYKQSLFLFLCNQDLQNMSHHPKIHPLHDPEAPQTRPTAPLVPRGASRSEHGDPTKDPLTQRPQHSVPLPPPKKRRRSCCCRCVCYTLCLLLLFVVAVGATIGILYLVFKPKLPDYSIDRLQLTRFTLNQDSSLSTAFNVTITAKNPNEKIGIYYEDGSKITVWYMEAKLSDGTSYLVYPGFDLLWFNLLDFRKSSKSYSKSVHLAGSGSISFGLKWLIHPRASKSQ